MAWTRSDSAVAARCLASAWARCSGLARLTAANASRSLASARSTSLRSRAFLSCSRFRARTRRACSFFGRSMFVISVCSPWCGGGVASAVPSRRPASAGRPEAASVVRDGEQQLVVSGSRSGPDAVTAVGGVTGLEEEDRTGVGDVGDRGGVAGSLRVLDAQVGGQDLVVGGAHVGAGVSQVAGMGLVGLGGSRIG